MVELALPHGRAALGEAREGYDERSTQAGAALPIKKC